MAVVSKGTRSTILTAVRLHLNQESVTIHSDAQLNAWIQESALEHWKAMMRSFEERDTTTQVFTSTASTRTYALATIATDNWDGKILYLHRSDANGVVSGRYIPVIDPSDEDRKTGWFLRGSNLHLSFAGGDVPGGQNYRVTFIQLPTDMDGNGVEHPLPIGHENVIIYDVVTTALETIPASTAGYERYMRRYQRANAKFEGDIEERTPFEVARVHDVFDDNQTTTERWS